MKKNRILLVEDDKQYGEMLQSILEHEGYSVDYIASPLDAIDKFNGGVYDLVISDFKMDELNGVRFLRLVKKIAPSTRTMILTASPTVENEAEAMDIKVDKYVLKEVRMDILLKYVEYLIMIADNVTDSEADILSSFHEKIVMSLDARTVRKEEVEIELTAKQFNLLRMFLENKGRAISRDEIISALWDSEFEEVDSRVVDGYVKELRRKMGIRSIISIRGFGYKWNE